MTYRGFESEVASFRPDQSGVSTLRREAATASSAPVVALSCSTAVVCHTTTLSMDLSESGQYTGDDRQTDAVSSIKSVLCCSPLRKFVGLQLR